MKWYDRQKQLYEKKSEPEETFQSAVDNTYDTQAESSKPLNDYEDTYVAHEEDDKVDEMIQNFQNERQMEPVVTQMPAMPMAAEDATTISKGTTLTGNIESDGDLVIRGHVKGDVVCNTNLSVFGTIEGMITCNNAYFENAYVVGDVGCSGNMELSETSEIHGDVEAMELLNGGRIKGNANIGDIIRFTQKSTLVGNISANEIEIERGAVIQGNISIRQDVFFED